MKSFIYFDYLILKGDEWERVSDVGSEKKERHSDSASETSDTGTISNIDNAQSVKFQCFMFENICEMNICTYMKFGLFSHIFTYMLATYM
jgi:hypothetical protein